MRAQHVAVIQIERIGLVPRGVVGRHVQRLEVVEVVFDLGAVLDREAEVREHTLQLAPRLGHRVQRASPGSQRG